MAASDTVFGFTFSVIDRVTRKGPKIRRELDLLDIAVAKLRKSSNEKIEAAGLSTFASQASKASRAARKSTRASTALGTSLTRLTRRSRSAGDGMRTLYSAMSLFTASRIYQTVRRSVMALGRALVDAIKIGADFDRQLQFSAQVMGATTNETARLRAEAKRLGATTSFTARDAARGFLVLGQAGYRAQDSINLLRPSMMLAGAGMTTLEKATQVTSDAIKVYKFQTSDAAKVTNILTAGFTSSSQSLLQLQDGLRQAGPVAAAAGRSLKETVAVLGLFANQGFRGSKGGVALRNILAQIQTPSKNLSRALSYLNLSMKDINPKTNDLATIFKRLEPLAKRADLTFQLFGKRTAPAFLAAMKAGSGALAEITKKMGDAKTAAQIYDKLMNTVAGRMDIAKSAVEALKIELFDAIKPVVKQDLKDVTSLVNSIQRAVKRGAPVIRAVFGAIGDVFRFTARVIGATFGSIGGAFSKLAKAGSMSKQAIADVVGPLVLGVTVMKLQVMGFISGFVSGLKKGWNQAAASLGPFVYGTWRVIVAVGEMTGFFKKGETGIARFAKVVGWSIGVFAAFAVAKLALLIPKFIIGSAFSMAMGLRTIAVTIWGALAPASIVATKALIATKLAMWGATLASQAFWLSMAKFTLIGGIVAGAAIMIYKYWNPIKAFFGSLWQSLKETAGPTLHWLGQGFRWVSDVIVGSFSIAMQFVGELFDSAMGGVKKLLKVMTYLPVVGNTAKLALAVGKLSEVSAFKKAFGAAQKARQKDLADARKKQMPSLLDKFMQKPATSAAKIVMPGIPKLPTMPKTPTLTAPTSGTGSASTGISNPIQDQQRSTMKAQASRVNNSQVRKINKFIFQTGAITINDSEIKDPEDFARKLLPVMQRLELEQELAGTS